MALAAEILVLLLAGAASLLLLAAGARGLAAESRVTRRLGRVDGATPDADLPAEERGFALLHPRGSDRNEVDRDLRVAGYTDPGAAAAFTSARRRLLVERVDAVRARVGPGCRNKNNRHTDNH